MRGMDWLQLGPGQTQRNQASPTTAMVGCNISQDAGILDLEQTENAPWKPLWSLDEVRTTSLWILLLTSSDTLFDMVIQFSEYVVVIDGFQTNVRCRKDQMGNGRRS